MHYYTLKPSFLTYDFQETTPLQWRKSDVLKENKKCVFSKKWVSQNMEKGMVPWLEIYFFISKTNLETLNFVLKFKKFLKNEIHTLWNGHKLKLVSHEH